MCLKDTTESVEGQGMTGQFFTLFQKKQTKTKHLCSSEQWKCIMGRAGHLKTQVCACGGVKGKQNLMWSLEAMID